MLRLFVSKPLLIEASQQEIYFSVGIPIEEPLNAIDRQNLLDVSSYLLLVFVMAPAAILWLRRTWIKPVHGMIDTTEYLLRDETDAKAWPSDNGVLEFRRLQQAISTLAQEKARLRQDLDQCAKSLQTADQRINSAQTLAGNLFENCLDAVVIINGSGQILSVNPVAEALFKTSEDALMGQSIGVLIPGLNWEEHKHNVQIAGPAAAGLFTENLLAVLAGTEASGSYRVKFSVSSWCDGEQTCYTCIMRPCDEG